MKRPLVLGFVALVLTGAGGHERRFGELRVTATGPVTLRTSLRPRFQGPGPNIADVALLSPRVGVVATRHDRGLPRARIQRTTDGGGTWHDVLGRKGQASFAWLAAAGSRIVYAGGLGSDGHPELSVSKDAGRTWTALRPRLPRVGGRDEWLQSRPMFVTPTFAYTVPDPASFMYGGFLRTRDGGRTWEHVRVPKYTAGIQFLDERRGFAAGTTEHRCGGALWRTDDGGASWVRVMCVRVPLAAVQFLDASHGFAAGGWSPATEAAPSAVVYATRDGGSTWQWRYTNPRTGYHGGISPIVELRFLDANRGWARTGQCKCCPSGPCAGDVLVTRDAARTWARRGEEVELSTVGARDAWTVRRCDIGCNGLWRTRNAGRSWRPLARPDLLELTSVRAAGGLVSLATEAGRFVSTDGRRWRFADADVLAARPGFSVSSVCSWRRCRLISRHGAQTFAFTGSAADAQSVAIADDLHAYALPYLGFGSECKTESTRRLYVTTNGGRSWERHRVPFNIASIAADGRFVAAVGLQHGCANVLALSHDDGRTWLIRHLPRKGCNVSVARGDVWLGCGDKLLFSADRGRTWILRNVPRSFDSSRVAAADRGGAWTLAWGGGLLRLWHTTDGGRTWLEQWPRLPTP